MSHTDDEQLATQRASVIQLTEKATTEQLGRMSAGYWNAITPSALPQPSIMALPATTEVPDLEAVPEPAKKPRNPNPLSRFLLIHMKRHQDGIRAEDVYQEMVDEATIKHTVPFKEITKLLRKNPQQYALIRGTDLWIYRKFRKPTLVA